MFNESKTWFSDKTNKMDSLFLVEVEKKKQTAKMCITKNKKGDKNHT